MNKLQEKEKRRKMLQALPEKGQIVVKGWPCVDCHGRPLRLGQKVAAKHCTGRYGQTDTVIGKLDRIGDFLNVDVLPGTTRMRWVRLSGRDVQTPAGQCMYPGGVIDEEAGVIRFFEVHHDFEHGHEKWIEVLEEEGRALAQ